MVPHWPLSAPLTRLSPCSQDSKPLVRLSFTLGSSKNPSQSQNSQNSVFTHSYSLLHFFQMNWILQWYWKDCQLLQDKGWNFWTSQCFFSRIRKCYFSLVDNLKICTKISNSYSNWEFVRCSKRSSMLPSNLRDMDPSPKLRRNSYSGNFNGNW